MSIPWHTFVSGVLGLSLVHALMPQHWLPFVIVGRRHKWSQKRVLGLLALGGLAHALTTIAVGLLVGFLGHQIDQRIENLQGVLPGLILFAFGGGFMLSGFQHRHSEISNKMAASSLVLMMAMSPCLVVAPFFMLLGPMDLRTLIITCVSMSVSLVVMMTVLGWFAMHGMSFVKLRWLEKHEPQIMGGLLMTLGVLFLIHH